MPSEGYVAVPRNDAAPFAEPAAATESTGPMACAPPPSRWKSSPPDSLLSTLGRGAGEPLFGGGVPPRARGRDHGAVARGRRVSDERDERDPRGPRRRRPRRARRLPGGPRHRRPDLRRRRDGAPRRDRSLSPSSPSVDPPSDPKTPSPSRRSTTTTSSSSWRRRSRRRRSTRASTRACSPSTSGRGGSTARSSPRSRSKSSTPRGTRTRPSSISVAPKGRFASGRSSTRRRGNRSALQDRTTSSSRRSSTRSLPAAIAAQVDDRRGAAARLVALDAGPKQSSVEQPSRSWRASSWAARILGVPQCPELYEMLDDVPGDIAAVPSAEPSTALGPGALSGLATKLSSPSSPRVISIRTTGASIRSAPSIPLRRFRTSPSLRPRLRPDGAPGGPDPAFGRGLRGGPPRADRASPDGGGSGRGWSTAAGRAARVARRKARPRRMGVRSVELGLPLAPVSSFAAIYARR